MLGARPNHDRARVPVSATAFVDWRAQMHNADCIDAPAIEGARRTLTQTARMVGRALATEKQRFHVSLRLYHGWHKGWQPTDGLKAAADAVDTTDFARLFGDRIAFSPTVQYGHTLLTALPERQHARPSIHRRIRCAISPELRSRRRRWWTRPSRRICSRGHTSRRRDGRLCLPRTTT